MWGIDLRSLTWLTVLLCLPACSDLSSPPGQLGESAQGQPSLAAIEDSSVQTTHIIALKGNPSPVQTASIGDNLESSLGIKVGRTYTSAFQGFSAEVPEEAVESLRNNPLIKYVEPNYVARPNDSQSGVDWGLDRIDQRTLPLDATYFYHHDAQDVYVYVIDSGIRETHSEFGGRAVGVWAYWPADTDDCYGHGTAVAAIAAGSTYGVAKQAEVRALRVADCNGNADADVVVDAFDWVIDNHHEPAVLIYTFCEKNAEGECLPNQSTDDAVDSALDAGIDVIVAAGNGNQDACNGSPARVPRALTVGATNDSDGRAYFGVDQASSWGSCVDIFAPGKEILTAGIASDDAEVSKKGTSFAAPFVAGVVAQFEDAKWDRGAYRAYVDTMIKLNATDDELTNLNGSPNRLIYSQFLDVTIEDRIRIRNWTR